MKNRFGSILLSIVIAFGLWLYVITYVSPNSEETYYNIPVVLEGESVLNERGLMCTSTSSSTVSLQLAGARSDLIKVNQNNITVKGQPVRDHRAGAEDQSALHHFLPRKRGAECLRDAVPERLLCRCGIPPGEGCAGGGAI